MVFVQEERWQGSELIPPKHPEVSRKRRLRCAYPRQGCQTVSASFFATFCHARTLLLTTCWNSGDAGLAGEAGVETEQRPDGVAGGKVIFVGTVVFDTIVGNRARQSARPRFPTRRGANELLGCDEADQIATQFLSPLSLDY